MCLSCELEAARDAEGWARSKAFWRSVGPGAPDHRKAAARVAYDEWQTAVAERERLEAGQLALDIDA